MKYLFVILLFCSLSGYSQMAASAGSIASRQKVDRDAHIALIDSGGASVSDTNRLFSAYEAIKRMKGHAHPDGSVNAWDSALVIRLYIGGTARAHAFNYKNPATFKATFVGSPTHNASGVTYNGGSQYENTGMAANNLRVATSQVSVLLNTDIAASASARSLFGVITSSNYRLIPRITVSSMQQTIYNAIDATNTQYVMPATTTSALWSLVTSFVNATTHNKAVVKNTTTESSTTVPTVNLTADNLFLAAANNGTTGAQFLGGNIQFFYAGRSVTDITIFNNIVQRLKTRLSR